MRTLVRLALQYRTVTLLAVGLLLGVGAVSAGQLEQELFPSIEPPFLVVTAALPGASPAEVADDLATPIEEVVSTGAGLDSFSSSSMEGFTFVAAEYEYGTDLDARQREIEDALGIAELPAAASTPQVQSFTPDSLPIFSVAVTGDDLDEVRSFVRNDLAPRLRAVDGVADVNVSGAGEDVVQVVLDPTALSRAGLGVTDVTAALAAAELSVPAGTVTDGDTLLPVRVVADTDPSAIADVLVPGPAAPGSGPAQPLRVGDLGDVVVDAPPPAQTVSRFNGEAAVTVELLKEQDANTVTTIDEVQEGIGDIALPEGVEIAEVVNQAPEISQGVADVTRDALIGALLALVMIVVFLRSWRGTVVAGVAIPLSLVAALALMNGTGITLNVLTLGALAVAAGRVVDDAIVVLENIYRNLELGLPRAEAVRTGTREVVGAVTSATLTAVAVFLPLAFIAGLAGEVFLGFALTTTFALLASLVVATTVVPVLGSLFLRRQEAQKADPENSPLRRAVRAPLRWALDHRGLTVGLAVLALAGSVASLATVPISLFPSTAADSIAVAIQTPAGTTLEQTAEEVGTLEEQIADLDDVTDFTTVVGGSLDSAGFGGGGSANAATITVALDDDAEASVLREELEDQLEELGLEGSVTAAQLIPGASDVAVQVLGDDFAAVTAATRDVEATIAAVDGLADVTSNLAETRNELTVEVDEQAAAALGLDAQGVAGLLRINLNPVPATTIDVDGGQRQVVATVDPAAVDSAEALEALPIAPGVSLGDIAAIRAAESPTGVTRYDGDRSAEVTGTVVAANVGEVTTLVQNAIDDLDLPDGVTVQQGGTSEQLGEVFTSMITVMAIAVALVYLVLVASFGSLLTPLVILGTLPLAAIGAFPALAVTGRELGLPALIGLLMLIGIVITNAIVLLEFVEQRKAAGLPTRAALLDGAQTRVRPILMTALTTVIGLVPLALGLSEGALLSASLATVVIGGLVSSTVLTLVVIPVMYSLMDQLRTRTLRSGSAQPDVTAADAAVATPLAAPAPSAPAARRLVGRFASQAEAEEALRRLVDGGVAAERLSVAARNGSGQRTRPRTRQGTSPLTRLATGWLRRARPDLLAPHGSTSYGLVVPDALADAAERIVTRR